MHFLVLPAKGFNASKSGRFHIQFLSRAAGLIVRMPFPEGRKGPGSGQGTLLRGAAALKSLLLRWLSGSEERCAVIRVTLKVPKD